MIALFTGFSFVWGAVWGSFLNVVIHRVPRDMSLVKPRSQCPSCGHQIRWFENVPLLSWLALRGRCSQCKTPISARYFLVELLTGCLSLALFLKLAHVELEGQPVEVIALPFLLLFLFVCAVISVSFIDLELTLIPDVITIPTAILGIIVGFVIPETEVYSALYPNPTWLGALIGAAVGSGFLLLVFLGYRAVTGRIGMGGGDFTMMAMLGAFLGWKALPLLLLLASTQGLVLALVAAGVEKLRGEKGGVLLRGVHRPEFWEDRPLPEDTPSENDDGNGEDAEGDPEDEHFGRMGIPFGPFLGLAALEILYFGATLEGILFGGI